MFSKILAHKKLVIIISVSVIVLAAATMFLVMGPLKTYFANKNADETSNSAYSLKADGIEAMKASKTDEAKALLEEAKEKYDAVGDTNNSVDVQAQLDIIEYEQKQATDPTTAPQPSTEAEIYTPAPY